MGLVGITEKFHTFSQNHRFLRIFNCDYSKCKFWLKEFMTF